MITVNDLSFQYPLTNKLCLNSISFSIEDGEIVVICGKSGSGKTTLLKHLKKELIPKGEREGSIKIDGLNVSEIPTIKVGYIFQNPDTQIVEDYVYHELAFGLENLGVPYDEMHNRVAEIVQYFHLEDIYDKHTYELSGGQKQILNLASVMIMQPSILLLDEPLTQLDPKGKRQFINQLRLLREDFGTTVIMISHQLDEIIDIIDRMIVLDEGKIKCIGNVQNVVDFLKDDELISIFPEYIQLLSYKSLPINQPFYKIKNIINPLHSKKREYSQHDICLEVKNLYGGYNDILSNFNLKVDKQEIFCLLGSNGSGKTTFLKCVMKVLKYKGKISYKGKIGYLPQEPLLLINRDCVYDELYKNYNKKEVDELVSYFEFEKLLNFHPYDLSGGQQQILAIMKLLLNYCDILLLDEPTKSIDSLMKIRLGKLLEKLVENGKTIICVSHDLEFCASYGTMISLLFHHAPLNPQRPEIFFKNNYFYTTQLSKLTKDDNHIISLKDVMP